MMGRPLRIHDPLFIAGVSLRDELSEGGVEMDVVRYEEAAVA